MVSARSSTNRLTFSGISSDSPFLADCIQQADLLGPAFEATPADMSLQDRRRLQHLMVDWRAAIRPPGPRVEEDDPQVIKALQDHGYWSPR